MRSGLAGGNLGPGKEKIPSLLLMTADRDFFSSEAVAADVVIDVAGAATVQAQIIAAGKLVNGDGSVEISGGLLAADIENAGRLRIEGAARTLRLRRRRAAAGFQVSAKFPRPFHPGGCR